MYNCVENYSNIYTIVNFFVHKSFKTILYSVRFELKRYNNLILQ